MIRIDTHGRKWIMAELKMESNNCPECRANPYQIYEGKPQENETKYWFDCECILCGCEWTVTYEKKIEHI